MAKSLIHRRVALCGMAAAAALIACSAGCDPDIDRCDPPVNGRSRSAKAPNLMRGRSFLTATACHPGTVRLDKTLFAAPRIIAQPCLAAHRAMNRAGPRGTVVNVIASTQEYAARMPYSTTQVPNTRNTNDASTTKTGYNTNNAVLAATTPIDAANRLSATSTTCSFFPAIPIENAEPADFLTDFLTDFSADFSADAQLDVGFDAVRQAAG